MVLAGFGLALVSQVRVQTAIAAVACAGMAAIAIAGMGESGLQRPDWRSVAASIDGQTAQALVVSRGGDDPLLYYLEDMNVERLPSEGAAVERVTVVRKADAPLPRITGTHPVGRSHRIEDFVLTEYRLAPRGRRVTGESLGDGDGTDVLIARPR